MSFFLPIPWILVWCAWFILSEKKNRNRKLFVFILYQMIRETNDAKTLTINLDLLHSNGQIYLNWWWRLDFPFFSSLAFIPFSLWNGQSTHHVKWIWWFYCKFSSRKSLHVAALLFIRSRSRSLHVFQPQWLLERRSSFREKAFQAISMMTSNNAVIHVSCVNHVLAPFSQIGFLHYQNRSYFPPVFFAFSMHVWKCNRIVK